MIGIVPFAGQEKRILSRLNRKDSFICVSVRDSITLAGSPQIQDTHFYGFPLSLNLRHLTNHSSWVSWIFPFKRFIVIEADYDNNYEMLRGKS